MFFPRYLGDLALLGRVHRVLWSQRLSYTGAFFRGALTGGDGGGSATLEGQIQGLKVWHFFIFGKMGIHPYLDAKKLAVESGLIDPLSLSSGYFFDFFFFGPREGGQNRSWQTSIFLRGWQAVHLIGFPTKARVMGFVGICMYIDINKTYYINLYLM